MPSLRTILITLTAPQPLPRNYIGSHTFPLTTESEMIGLPPTLPTKPCLILLHTSIPKIYFSNTGFSFLTFHDRFKLKPCPSMAFCLPIPSPVSEQANSHLKSQLSVYPGFCQVPLERGRKGTREIKRISSCLK